MVPMLIGKIQKHLPQLLERYGSRLADKLQTARALGEVCTELEAELNGVIELTPEDRKVNNHKKVRRHCALIIIHCTFLLLVALFIINCTFYY
jgi:hypothetical protein